MLSRKLKKKIAIKYLSKIIHYYQPLILPAKETAMAACTYRSRVSPSYIHARAQLHPSSSRARARLLLRESKRAPRRIISELKRVVDCLSFSRGALTTRVICPVTSAHTRAPIYIYRLLVLLSRTRLPASDAYIQQRACPCFVSGFALR